MAYFRCPVCGRTYDYKSDDIEGGSYYNLPEDVRFRCKHCDNMVELEIVYNFDFFETLIPTANGYDIDGEELYYYDDVDRFTIEDAREQFMREAEKRAAHRKKNLFSVGTPTNQPKALGTASSTKSYMPTLFAPAQKPNLFAQQTLPATTPKLLFGNRKQSSKSKSLMKSKIKR